MEVIGESIASARAVRGSFHIGTFEGLQRGPGGCGALETWKGIDWI